MERDRKILEIEKTSQDPMLDYANINELIGDEGKAKFQDYKGLSIASTWEWFNHSAIHILINWITDGIYQHYHPNESGDRDIIFALHLISLGRVINEGIKNALEHGNESRPERKVNIKWKLQSIAVGISIIDEGRKPIDLIPKEPPITGDLLEEVFSGGGKGVVIIKKDAEKLGGSAEWIPIMNKKGEKIGTELKITVPVSKLRS